MTSTSSHLRKAAVLIRSLDSDTAAIVLGQLSAGEATELRAAMLELGAVDPDEQADVAAEFHRIRPMADQAGLGVELSLSAMSQRETGPPTAAEADSTQPAQRRFEFLANASTNAIVAFLSREHAQTIAVVLAHLAAGHAAAVLAALPEKLQVDTVERLSALGETDPESVVVLERELASWLAARGEDRGVLARRRETVANILAATDAKTRRGILTKVRSHNSTLAEQLSGGDGYAPRSVDTEPPTRMPFARIDRDIIDRGSGATYEARYASEQASDTRAKVRRSLAALKQPTIPIAPPPPLPITPTINFDQLIHLDDSGLTTVIRGVDANVLAVALIGSHENLIDRICRQMPRRVARGFRRELKRVGPTRLSDVETAQRIVVTAAARHLADQRLAAAMTS